jgi:hypothetical protein
MGLWFRGPTLLPNETVLWRARANHQQSALRVVGGRLYATETRIVFQANRPDARMGGSDWSVLVESVTRIALLKAERVAPAPSKLMRLRRRLAIHYEDQDAVFGVPHADAAVEELCAILSRKADRHNTPPDSNGDQ